MNRFQRLTGLPRHIETLTLAYLSWKPTGVTAGGTPSWEDKGNSHESMYHARIVPALQGTGAISVDHISIGERPEFEKNDPVIMNSFRILAPGANVPTKY